MVFCVIRTLISEESASAFKSALSVYNLGLSPEAHASMKEVARAISNTMKNRNELVFSGLTETISQFAELSKMMQPVSDSTRNLAKLLSEALNSNVESANKSANKSLNESANSADNSDVNLRYFSKRHEQIISVMDNGKEYTTENIATLIGLKGPRTRQLMKELVEMGLVESLGTTRNRRYRKVN